MNKLENVLKVFANKNRLRIMKMLEGRNMCVCEITAVLGIKQPSVTAHLLKLKNAGMLGERQKGLYTEFFIIKENSMRNIWKVVSESLNAEPQIEKDLQKAKHMDRYEICKQGKE